MNKRSLGKYIIRRIMASVVVLFLASVIVFVAVRACPGDPVANRIGPYGDYSPENIARVEKELGLDKSYVEQYAIWITNCLRGDFGLSLRNGASITEIVMDKLVISLELIIASVFVALVIAIPSGVLAGIKQDTVIDKVFTTLSNSFLAMPGFCVGLMLIVLFSVEWNILPSNGYVPFSENPAKNIQCLIMPALTLGIFVSASIYKFIRTDTGDAFNSNYVRTAIAKGVSRRRIYFLHILKNIAVTIVTVTGTEIATLLGGTVIVEQVFGWSGLGWYVYSSVSNRDYPAVQGSVLIIAIGFILINTVMDILYTIIDPRIDLE